ncbi:MAG: NUDIX hydrolase [Candidatus Levybacteria bacterium RIFCSPHIGHO2_01_FULL_36_15]|nr:MAG: NUDIX hydrolase [Candidatus Levybacteria bacterium RIFCSPHIGHO2_01_FULL_36_15]OGH37279.1 MAG: NUDIX hydrolase [Candidatus Levybacteria bacterium RIFCSPLOWO2_01_FULL_36_10]
MLKKSSDIKNSKERFKLIPAVYLFLIKNNKILLLKRFNTSYEDGNYSVIAGHLDGEETALQAIVREAKEETGISLNKKDISFIHIMHRKSSEEERMDLAFIARKWRGNVINRESNKCSELRWFSLKRLPENIVPCVRDILFNYLTGVYYSEFGWNK